jgi:methyl-CpG-binding domain protein 4
VDTSFIRQQVPSLVGQAVQERGEEKRKGKRSKPGVVAASPSPSIPTAVEAATTQILEVAVEGTTARKEQRRGKMEQWQSSQQPSPVDVHPQGGEGVVDGGISGTKSVGRSCAASLECLHDCSISLNIDTLCCKVG